MPYAVWIELSDPDPPGSDDLVHARRPALVLELIEAGGSVEGPVLDPDDDEDFTAEEPVALLDVRVLTYPEGARVGLAVGAVDLPAALAVGLGLARYLSGTPELFGWRLESISGAKLDAPLEPDVWLPSVEDDRPRFPVAEHLPRELQEPAAQYLLAAAAADVNDPAGRGPWRVDAADLVAGSVEHPWGRELVAALGGLLVAACRAEGVRHPLVGRGGGDTALAQALLDAVRADHDDPGTGVDHDGLRGHLLLDEFATAHDLQWTRVDPDADPDLAEERRRAQLRALLWAGLRCLATMGRDGLAAAESPWVWLADLDSDDVAAVVDHFADRDAEETAEAEEEAEALLYGATQAHLLVRLALLHPELLAADRITAAHNDLMISTEPLQHLGFHALTSLGSAALDRAALPDHAVPAARTVRSALRAVDAEEDEALDDLYAAIERLLPARGVANRDRQAQTTAFLDLVTAMAGGGEDAARVARELLAFPAELASIVADLPDGGRAEHTLRLRVLAAAASLDPAVAGEVAADLPALRSKDPRDEPALHAEATTWWARAVRAFGDAPELVAKAVEGCPEPGASLLRRITAPSPLDDLPTATAAVAVVQAISALGITAQEPYLPHEIIVG
ncbi:hypothetical protein [Saccharothrix variisporea]|uniref:Uncharacterized protein n=1 Tax=Saccharothrix variisporea TaxID=543527 RepID=A0A495X3X3_9PSEU|nr:hypothetical protein [Saccharothrix variisporea]RKT67945.1 hypothetical protein DFJ66_1124 [Saccharothrix variisporea]